MRNCLMVVQVPGLYYRVTMIGWVRRIKGDEYDILPGARTIIRNRNASPRTIASLASAGPQDDHTLSTPSDGVEFAHRFGLFRPTPANHEAWIAHCPMPTDWNEK